MYDDKYIATGPVTPTNDNSNPQSGSIGIISESDANSDEYVKHLSRDHQDGKLPSKSAVQQPRKISSGDMMLSSTSAPTPFNSSNNGTYTKDARKLFVGGLPQDITEPEFQTFFAQFGELHEAIVMFDRDTKTSRGFGFVTFVDPEVAKSLLRMGGYDDGIGRLDIRGKTCEVKAATPRGEGSFPGKKLYSRGSAGGANHQYHRYRYQHQQYGYPYQQHMNNHMVVPFAHAGSIGYPMMSDGISGSVTGSYASLYHHHPGFNLTAANAYGPMTSMYYPSMNDAGMPLSPSSTRPSVYDNVVTPLSPPGPSPPFYLSLYDPTVTGTATAAVVPEYHNHTSTTFAQQPTVAYVPMMQTPSIAGSGVEDTVNASLSQISTSVMPYVAPSIPIKGIESSESTKKVKT
ncbi:RNA-binding protein [Nitzschia inconspicua]|uniref:RNA-binding protein n=1 Tax=Nitzschia inconspicua TaxID=303405 RepID=A0A9K3KVW3_9STRA|nr:RNA-binding protein [Nitzschia inconspicua]